MLPSQTTGDPTGPALLFLHGFMGLGADWAPVVERLADRYRCITVDLPGHGAGAVPGPFGFGATIDALGEVLNAHGIAQAVWVGYSMGGRLALHAALTRPERMRALVMESASPGLASPEARAARRAEDEARAQRLEAEPFEAFLERWYRLPLFTSLARHPDLLQARIARRVATQTPDRLADALRALGTGRQPSGWERLGQLRPPALALAGALDAKYVQLTAQMAHRQPALQVAVVPGAGHDVHTERIDTYLAVLRPFLRDVTAPGPLASASNAP